MACCMNLVLFAFTDTEDIDLIESNAQRIFEGCKLGKIIQYAVDNSSLQAIWKLYMHDYIHFIYAAQSSSKVNEYKVITFYYVHTYLR